MTVKLLAEDHLEFLCLKGDYTSMYGNLNGQLNY